MAISGLSVILAVLVTAVGIRASLDHGRLRCYATLDDVLYYAEAYRLIHEASGPGGGAGGLVREVLRHPPRSVYSTAMAAVAFLTLGHEDWMPSALSGLVVCGFLIASAVLTRGRALVERLLILAGIGASPLLMVTVQQFRPDLAHGLLLGFAAAWSALCPTRMRWRRSVVLGFLLGLAIWVRPTGFPLTIALGGVCAGAAALTNARGLLLGCRKAWGSLAIAGGTAAGVAAPYAIVGGPAIIDYLRRVMASPEREQWVFKGTALEHARYFVNGHGGTTMLGPMVWLCLGVIAWGAGVVLVRSRRTERLIALRLGVALLASWCVPTISPVKNAYLGATFQTLLVLVSGISAAYLLRCGVRGMGAKGRGARAFRAVRLRAGLVLGASVTAVWVLTLTLPRTLDRRPTEKRLALIDRRHRIVTGMIEDALGYAEGHPGPIVVVNPKRDLGPWLVEYWSGKLGRFRAGGEVWLSDAGSERGQNARVIGSASVIIANEGGTLLTNDNLGRKDNNEAAVRLLRSLPGLRVLKEYPIPPTGRRVIVFGPVEARAPGTDNPPPKAPTSLP